MEPTVQQAVVTMVTVIALAHFTTLSRLGMLPLLWQHISKRGSSCVWHTLRLLSHVLDRMSV
jgi:hypothetical protein